MANKKRCDICNQISEAFTDNTTSIVTCNNKQISIFVKVSTTAEVDDICNACFAKLLSKLGKKLKEEVV